MTVAKSQEIGCTITLSQDVRGNVRYEVSATDVTVEATLETLQKALTGARTVITNNGLIEAHEATDEETPEETRARLEANLAKKNASKRHGNYR